MSRLWVLAAVVGVTALGLVRIVAAIRRHERERLEVRAFAELFQRYLEIYDQEAYHRLIERSYRIQELLGPAGVMGTYIAPFRTHLVQGYQIILNALPEMRKEHQFAIKRTGHQELIGETLGRYFGLSADLIRERQRELRNPLVWFREGVRALLLWPLQLLESLGLGSGSRTASLARSSAFQTISGAVAVISFVASVIEILLGWEQTLDAVRGLLGR